MFETYLFRTPPHCINLPKTKAVRSGNITGLLNINLPGFHPVSSEPPLPNTICRDLYRMAKMKRIVSNLTLLSLHFTCEIDSHFFSKIGVYCPACSCYYYKSQSEPSEDIEPKTCLIFIYMVLHLLAPIFPMTY